jgi:hypothetical protein
MDLRPRKQMNGQFKPALARLLMLKFAPKVKLNRFQERALLYSSLVGLSHVIWL